MRLSKSYIDVGLMTNQRESMLLFWGEEVGLTFDEQLKLGGGVHQLRHDLNGSVFKLNHARSALTDEEPTGYQGLMIADDNSNFIFILNSIYICSFTTYIFFNWMNT